MSALVKLAGALPGEVDLNGLDAIRQNLIDSPEEVRTAVVTFTVREVKTNVEAGTTVPTVEIRRFEPVTSDNLAQGVHSAMLEAAGERTGKAPLPVDTVEVVDETGQDSF